MFFHIQQKQNQERFQWPEHMHFQKCFLSKHTPLVGKIFCEAEILEKICISPGHQMWKTYFGAFFWNRSPHSKLPPFGDFCWWQQYSCENVCSKKNSNLLQLWRQPCAFLLRNTGQVGPGDPTQPKTINSDHRDTNFSWMSRSNCIIMVIMYYQRRSMHVFGQMSIFCAEHRSDGFFLGILAASQTSEAS